MKRAFPEDLPQTIERNRLIEMLFNVAADLLGGIRLRIAAERPRPAINAGTGDREDELSVAARIAPDNCIPALVVAVAGLGPADLGRTWLGAGWLSRVRVQ